MLLRGLRAVHTVEGMNTSTPSSQTSDRVRQIVVAVTVAIAIVLAFIGSGAFGGTAIQDAAGGALSSGATVLGPSGIAFSIWSVIYTALAGYTIWQALPGQADRAIHRDIGYGVALSAVFNAVWIGSIQLGLVFASLVIIVVLLVILLVLFAKVRRRVEQGSVVEIIFVDGMIGLYLGWVTIATGANLAAVLADQGFESWTQAPGWPGVIALIGVASLAIAVALRGGRLAPSIATAWGMSWIAVERWTATPEAPLVATAAVIIAALIVLVAVIAFIRRVAKRGVLPAEARADTY